MLSPEAGIQKESWLHQVKWIQYPSNVMATLKSRREPNIVLYLLSNNIRQGENQKNAD